MSGHFDPSLSSPGYAVLRLLGIKRERIRDLQLFNNNLYHVVFVNSSKFAEILFQMERI